MSDAERNGTWPGAGLPDVLELSLALTALWMEALDAALTTFISTWSTLSKVGAGYVTQTIDLERMEALAAADNLDEAVREELNALEQGADRLIHVDEDTLADVAGGPIFLLPE